MLQALDAFRRHGDQNGTASALANLSRAYLDTGRVTEAVSLAEQSLAICRVIGATLRLANSRYALALALAQAGRTDDALAELALATSHGTGNNRLRANALSTLGRALERTQQALDEPTALPVNKRPKPCDVRK
ncbi:tetratricopeptide repeat protein [Streptomyces sp. NPDC017529]|uniref:tetratricopeptide repeat protein n=1 Tax=Streptomyces sp. NPDC017529 TaxID=3365000 RepID=UPI0037AB9DD7